MKDRATMDAKARTKDSISEAGKTICNKSTKAGELIIHNFVGHQGA